MNTTPIEKARRRFIDYRMIWRWHFYAGLVCIPFILILSFSGSLYLFKPQIEAFIDRPYDALVAPKDAKPLSIQVQAALSANPGTQFSSVEVRPNPGDAARVILDHKGEKRRVYIHPASLSVLKTVPEDTRFMNVVKRLHGELFSGQTGTLIVETAACWAIVMIITGLYLWWPRDAKGLAGVLWPRLNRGRRQFWRDLHAVVGLWVSTFALFLLISGLPWTTVWGAGFKSVRQALTPPEVKADWATGPAAHHEHHADASSPTNLGQIDRMATLLRAETLPPPVMLTAPSKGKPWQGVSQSQNRTVAATVSFDAEGQITGRKSFSDKPLIDRVVSVSISAHEGQLFGWFNQALGILTALGLVTLCVSAIVMWWNRRPDAARLGAPQRLPDERLGPGLAILILSLGALLPMMGISLIVMGLTETLVLRRIPLVRNWLGLSSTPH